MKPGTSADLRVNAWLGFITNTQLWIGLGAGLQTWMNLNIRGETMQDALKWGFFLGAVTVLLYQVPFYWRWIKKEDLQNNVRSRWLWKNRHWELIVSLSAGITCLWTLPGFTLRQLLPLGWAAIPALAYMLPLLPWKGEWRALRQFGLLKTSLVSAVWVLVTLVLPDLAAIDNWAFIGILFTERFLFLFGLVLLFDWRDRLADEQAGISTLAVGMGVNSLLKLQGVLVILLFLIAWWLPSGELRLVTLLEASSILALSWFAPGKNWYYYTFWVDGALVITPLAWWLFST